MLILSFQSFGSLVPPDYCGDADLHADSTLKSIGLGKYACYLPSVHCVDETKCPEIMPFPENICGDAKAVVVWKFNKIGNNLSCKMPTLHCVKEDLCPQFSPIPPNYCQAGEDVVVKTTYRKINEKYSCGFPSAYCVDQSRCPQY